MAVGLGDAGEGVRGAPPTDVEAPRRTSSIDGAVQHDAEVGVVVGASVGRIILSPDGGAEGSAGDAVSLASAEVSEVGSTGFQTEGGPQCPG